MLAIFDGTVAKRPDCMKMPHTNAVSALKDDFLVKHFTSVYPGSVAVSSKDSFAFAYLPTAPLPRFHFAHKDDIFCMYQGFIKNVESFKEKLELTGIDNEALLMIEAFQILKKLGHVSNASVPAAAVEDISGNCITVLYEMSSKSLLMAGGSYWDIPIYWGIDARFSLVISNDETIVEKACGCFQQFQCGQVYACCKGQTGLEAIFKNKPPESKDLTDMNTPVPLSVESVTAMILQADMDRSKPYREYWQPPVENVLKINTAAEAFPGGNIGIGVIVRNSKGEVELAVSRRKKMPASYANVQAFMEGVYMAVGFKYRRCVFELPHLNIEKHKEIEDFIGCVGKLIAENMSEFGISFVTDSANKAARVLAKYSRRNEHCVWDKETPDCIARIVADESL